MLRDRGVSFLLAVALLCVCVPGRSAMIGTGEEAIVEFVKKIYSETDVQVIFAGQSQPIRDRARIKNISFAKVPDTSGDGICLVTVEGRNRSDTNLYVPFKVQAKRRLYSLKHNIRKGDTITLNDISAKETFLQGGPSIYPFEVQDVVGKAAKKELMAGEILTKQMLEEHVAVTKGETVSMTVEKKDILVQGKGLALEKGRMGDLVRVKSPSGKEIFGRVTGNGSVSVEF